MQHDESVQDVIQWDGHPAIPGAMPGRTAVDMKGSTVRVLIDPAASAADVLRTFAELFTEILHAEHMPPRKAERILATGRLSVQVDDDSRIEARCTSDSYGDVLCGWTPEEGWWCTCGFLAPFVCEHSQALRTWGVNGLPASHPSKRQADA